MRNAPVRKTGPVPSEQPRNKLRSAAPLLEGARTLSDQEVHNVLTLFGSKRAGGSYIKFMEAKEEAAETFGAVLELVGGDGNPTKVVARHEFRTTDRSLDPDLEQMVAAMGFRLSLRSKPRDDLPLDERYDELSRVEMTPEGPKKITWYEQKAERTYVICEANYGTCDVQYAPRTAQNFLRLLQMLRPPVAEDMPRPQLPPGVVDISSARPSQARPASGSVLADQALTAMKTSL
jgi:hypothetical protein